VLAEGAEAVATVLARGREGGDDLAVLEVSLTLPVAPLAPDAAVELGDDLVVVGAPFGKALSVTAGIVSQVEYEPAENAAAPLHERALKTDAAVGYGSSGGGVFDVPAGRLVGLVEGYRTARVSLDKAGDRFVDVPMPGETFVTPACRIRDFLGAHGLARLAGGSVVAWPEARARGWGSSRRARSLACSRRSPPISAPPRPIPAARPG
jgi:S1-C subfamily serine protease